MCWKRLDTVIDFTDRGRLTFCTVRCRSCSGFPYTLNLRGSNWYCHQKIRLKRNVDVFRSHGPFAPSETSGQNRPCPAGSTALFFLLFEVWAVKLPAEKVQDVASKRSGTTHSMSGLTERRWICTLLVWDMHRNAILGTSIREKQGYLGVHKRCSVLQIPWSNVTKIDWFAECYTLP